MFEAAKDILYRYVGLFPPELPHIREIEPIDERMKEVIENLHTVCLFLGPNRNLTTLTGSVLALHPNCQVLSHGGNRVLPIKGLNFLESYNEDKFQKFCQFALFMSQNGDKGSFGGSVVMTHAFRNHTKMKNMYRRRYGRMLMKRHVHCLVWKEAHRVDDYVSNNRIDLGKLMAKNPKFRFIMPVRNPLDVTLSFSAHPKILQKYFPRIGDQDLKTLLDRIWTRWLETSNYAKITPTR